MRTQSKGLLGILIPDGSPTSVLALGLCCALAVTSRLADALTAGMVLIAVSVCSGILLSAIRRILPQQIDIVIGTFVVTVLTMAASSLAAECGREVSPLLSADMGLISLNSVLFSRRKPFALRHNPASSAFEGLLRSLAYTLVMLIVALFREVLGYGTIFGHHIFYSGFNALAEGNGFAGLMTFPPMALILFGVLLWLLMRNEEEELLQPRFNTSKACGTGFATFIVIMLSMPMIWLMDRYVMEIGAMSWIDPSFDSTGLDGIRLAVSALISVAFCRMVKILSDRLVSSENMTMDVYFPIISVNASIISARLIPFGECSFGLLFVNAALAGLACFAAIAAFASISDKTACSDVPKGLRGPGIAFIIAGLAGFAAMAFLGVKI